LLHKHIVYFEALNCSKKFNEPQAFQQVAHEQQLIFFQTAIAIFKQRELSQLITADSSAEIEPLFFCRLLGARNNNVNIVDVYSGCHAGRRIVV
jgi:hypothetical protein